MRLSDDRNPDLYLESDKKPWIWNLPLLYRVKDLSTWYVKNNCLK